jgi:hypothetical protein
MTNKFGLFINLNYAHHPHNECNLVWKKLQSHLSKAGFVFEKRYFAMTTDKSRDDLVEISRQVLDDLQNEIENLYSYLNDCYVVNLNTSSDLMLPDTSTSIDVEDISTDELNALGVEYDSLIKK